MDQCALGLTERPQSTTAWVAISEKAPRCEVVFQRLYPLALRDAALRLALPEDEVTCKRERRYDRFSDVGRVPPRQMLSHGYWFDCPQCGVRIQADNPETPLDRVLVNSYEEVFCQPKCAIAHESVRQERNKRFEAFKKKLQKRFPNLNFTCFYGGYPQRFDSAQFEFPGGMFPGTVQEIEEGLRWCVSEVDAEPWQIFAEQCGLMSTQ